MYDVLFQPVASVLNIKPATEKALVRLGIHNLRDLLFYKPYSHKIFHVEPDLSNVRVGSEIVTNVTIHDIEMPKTRRSPIKIYAGNNSGQLLLVFFNKIAPFIFAKLKQGAEVTIAGKIEQIDRAYSGGIAQINHPEFYFRRDLVKPVQPLYHLTYGIINKQLYGYILDAVSALEIAVKARINFGNMAGKDSSNIFDNEKEYLTNLITQVKKLHLIQNPTDKPTNNIFGLNVSLEEAIKNLAALELYANQVSLHNLRSDNEKNIGHVMKVAADEKEGVLSRLGFTLTEGQQAAIAEIETDQQSNIQMMRLLQGDVGSGKTLVALLTMLNSVNSGFQACLMAPTDLLSQQHYEFFCKALQANIDGEQYRVALLTGKTGAKDRRLINEGLKSGQIDILIGTHALFQNQVEFSNLGYVIIDEQHRFGVQQRMELINKASHPDVLVMTATPIPRSLTLTMFGDMAVSQIKNKPKNRLPIITARLSTQKRNDIIDSLQSKFSEGDRVYWVCPLIDQSDKLIERIDEEGNVEELANFQYSDVTARAKELESVYPGRGAVLHGKMKPAEKDEVMSKFKEGELDYIVATTVIEVGIDVPEATLIVIENAEKFGLAQLHQLRGRVGRGHKQSHCVLLYNPQNYSQTARERLKIMHDSNDGFYISEQDLILRGGGEILGTRQSGEPDFYFADLGKHTDILIRANKLAIACKQDVFQDFQLKLFSKEQGELAKSG